MLMGETKTHHFYDVGILEPVTKPPKPILFNFGDTRTPKQNQKKQTMFYHSCFDRHFETSKL